MSPVTLSAPSSQALHPMPQRKGVRFGESPQEPPKGPEGDKLEIKQPAETAPAEGVNGGDTSESKTPETPKAPEPPTAFQKLKERLQKFFHRIAKAFQKLFAPEKQQTELDRDLKQFQNVMKQSFKQVRKDLHPEAMHARLKERAKEIQETGSSDEKKEAADLLEAAKTDEGLKKFVNDNFDELAKARFQFMSQQAQEKMAELVELLAGPDTKDIAVQTEPESKDKPKDQPTE